jgi:hypothetical protein
MLRKEEEKELYLRRTTVFKEGRNFYFEVVGMWVSIIIFWIVGLLW